MKKWSIKNIIIELKTKSEELKHSPSAREISGTLYQACLRYFGWFNKAKKAARLRINKIKHHWLPKSAFRISKELAYILGVERGDGYCFYKRYSHGTSAGLVLKVKDKDFAANFKDKLEEWSKLPVSFNLGRSNFYHVNIYSVEVAKLISNFDLNKDSFPGKIHKIYFLKGLFDSEGSVAGYNLSKRAKACRWVSFSNSNKDTINLLSEFLNDLRINHKIKSRIHSGFGSMKLQYEVYIYGRQNLIKYNDLINFSIKRKQKILKAVLASYVRD